MCAWSEVFVVSTRHSSEELNSVIPVEIPPVAAVLQQSPPTTVTTQGLHGHDLQASCVLQSSSVGINRVAHGGCLDLKKGGC